MIKETNKTFLVCGRCRTSTIHTLLCSEESDFRHCDADGYFHHEPATYHVFKCDGCIAISMYVWSGFHSPHTDFGECTYPPPVAEESGIPEAVRTAYREAENVKYHSQAAYAVLARKVLEEIARERGVNERNLSSAIAILAEKGEIPPLLAEATTFIRMFGNLGAHYSGRVSGIHAEMIEKFLEALIQHLYVAPSALRQFKFLLDLESAEKQGDSQFD